MANEHAAEVARLHISGIDRGFLSRLGPRFLADLYRAINQGKWGFMFVALDEEGRLGGYVCGATSVRCLYRSVLLRCGWRYTGTAVKYLLDWPTLRGIVESVAYPVRTGDKYPDAELLSIVVREDLRGASLATDLLAVILTELGTRGCQKVRLIVGAELARANAYYVKNGFKQVGTILSHGRLSNVLVIDVNRPEPVPDGGRVARGS